MRSLPSSLRNSGSALVIVLWAVVLIAFAVAIASEKVGLVLGDATIRARRLQAELLAKSSYAYLEKILQDERKHGLEGERGRKPNVRRLDLNRFMGTWKSDPQELGGGLFWIEVEDEQSRINWLKTPTFVWRHLLRNAGMKPEEIDAWFDCLNDWQDADDARGLNGAENFDYQGLREDRRRAKNAPITEVGEIYWVMGGPRILDLQVPVDLQGTIKPLVACTTVYGDGKINLNTAPAFLIAAAMDISTEDAEQMVARRWGPDKEEGTEDDVFVEGASEGQSSSNPVSPNPAGGGAAPAQATPAVTTSSTYFRVRGVGKFGDQRVVCEALAKKDGQGGLVLLRVPHIVEQVRVASHGESQWK